tara:strand:- start:219 stop:341 length:123 start_codon:yes stop_codon:yes gene_type:complete
MWDCTCSGNDSLVWVVVVSGMSKENKQINADQSDLLNDSM